MTAEGYRLPTLSASEALELIPALCAHLAGVLDVRVLLIKGPVATQQGLRTDHVSVDVDLLVDPSGFGAFLAGLGKLGWARRVEPRRSEVLARHSATLRHPAWPCELDIHSYYPGFLGPPALVFDAVWERHDMALLAGRQVPVASTAANAAILALHALRDEASGQPHDAYLDLVEHVTVLSAEQKIEISHLAGRTGAHRTLSAFLQDIGAPSSLEASAEDPLAARDWHLMSVGAEVTGVASLVELRRSQPWRWPGILWRAFMLDEEELNATDELRGAGTVSLWAARLRRLARGLKGLPSALRSLRAARR